MKALIAIDGSVESALAVETASRLAWPEGSRLEVLTVLPTDAELFGGPWSVGVAYVPTEGVHDRLEAERRPILDAAVARLQRPGLVVVSRLANGRPASVIVESARQLGTDLIILGARGHGLLEGVLLGSVSAEVVDQAHCAVLVARRPSTGRILIGTDGSDEAMSAVAFVGGTGLFSGAEARVVHAIDLHPDWWLGYTPVDAVFATDAYAMVADHGRKHANEMLSTAIASLRSHGLRPSAAIIDGPAAAAIAADASTWDADVIVVGTRGNGLLKRLLLGGTARSLLHHAGASVLITRGQTAVPPPEADVIATGAAGPAPASGVGATRTG